MKAKELKAILKNDNAEVIVNDHGARLVLSLVQEEAGGNVYQLIPGNVYDKKADDGQA